MHEERRLRRLPRRRRPEPALAAKQLPGRLGRHVTAIENGKVEPRRRSRAPASRTPAPPTPPATPPTARRSTGSTAAAATPPRWSPRTWATGAQDACSARTPAPTSAARMPHPTTGAVEAYAVNYLKTEWTRDRSGDQGRPRLPQGATSKGEFGGAPRAPTTTTSWIVSNDPVDRAADGLPLRPHGQHADRALRHPARAGRRAAGQPMHPVEIRSRDGLTLVSYLTLPPGTDPDGDGLPDAARADGAAVHGGPWARDGYGFNAHAPVARQPRLRGAAASTSAARPASARSSSTPATASGAGKMHDDLIDAVDWAVEHGHHQPRQGRDHGRQLRRLRHAGRADLHARDVRLRRRHRRPVEPRDAARDHPAVLGAGCRSMFTSAMGDPRHAGGQGAAARPLAAVPAPTRSSGRC